VYSNNYVLHLYIGCYVTVDKLVLSYLLLRLLPLESRFVHLDEQKYRMKIFAEVTRLLILDFSLEGGYLKGMKEQYSGVLSLHKARQQT
jgi:hypothetical protein